MYTILFIFFFQLNEVITKYNLNTIADKLRETADKIPLNSDMDDVRTSLKNQALHLRTYQDNLVTPMTEQTKEMIDLANKLETSLLFNRSSFEEALKSLQKEIQDAQDFIVKNGTEFVQNVTQKLVLRFKSEIDFYLDLVITKTQNELGKCGPLSTVYNSALVATCNRVIDPFVNIL